MPDLSRNKKLALSATFAALLVAGGVAGAMGVAHAAPQHTSIRTTVAHAVQADTPEKGDVADTTDAADTPEKGDVADSAQGQKAATDTPEPGDVADAPGQ